MRLLQLRLAMLALSFVASLAVPDSAAQWTWGRQTSKGTPRGHMEVSGLDEALASSVGWPAERPLSEQQAAAEAVAAAAAAAEVGSGVHEAEARAAGHMVGPRVLFLVHHTRNTTALMRSVRSTWCRGLRACVFFSDQEQPPTEDGVAAVISAPESLKPVLTSYQIAQLRYLPALHAIRERMLRDGDNGLLARTEWFVQADDDTFVFYNNLLRRLDALSNSSDEMRAGVMPMYTGDVIAGADSDGWQRRLPVHTSIPFAMGGGSTVINRRALELMDTPRCLTRSLPGGDWWLWQSDWAIGACADSAGVSATPQPVGVFNQFACSARTLAYCTRKESRFFAEP